MANALPQTISQSMESLIMIATMANHHSVKQLFPAPPRRRLQWRAFLNSTCNRILEWSSEFAVDRSSISDCEVAEIHYTAVHFGTVTQMHSMHPTVLLAK